VDMRDKLEQQVDGNHGEEEEPHVDEEAWELLLSNDELEPERATEEPEPEPSGCELELEPSTSGEQQKVKSKVRDFFILSYIVEIIA
jgi:hypothetical protein